MVMHLLLVFIKQEGNFYPFWDISFCNFCSYIITFLCLLGFAMALTSLILSTRLFLVSAGFGISLS